MTDFLVHYGVKGQKWRTHQQGKWQNQAVYAIGDQRHSDGSHITLAEQKKITNKLLTEMTKDWDYGVMSSGKKLTYDNGLDSYDWTRYRTIPVKDLQKNKVGVCWDYVNYQHDYFKKNGIKDDSYLIYIEDPNNDAESVTHTFSVVHLKDGDYWFDTSGGTKSGLHKIDSPIDVAKQYLNRTGRKGIDEDFVEVYKYDADGLDNRLSGAEYFNAIFKPENQILGEVVDKFGKKTTYTGQKDSALADKFDAYIEEARKRLNAKHPFDAMEGSHNSKFKMKDPPIEKLEDLKMQDGTKTVKEIRNQINHPDDNDAGRHFNCPNCAVAFEMSERGYDVCARTKTDRSNVGNIDKFFINGKLKAALPNNEIKGLKEIYQEWAKAIFKESKTKNTAKKAELNKEIKKLQDKYMDIYEDAVKVSVKNLEKAILKQGDGARGIVLQCADITAIELRINPDIRTSGFHAFNYKVENGKVKFYDVQGKNSAQQNGNAGIETDWIDPRDLYYMRTDNLDLSPLVTTAVYSNYGK